MKHKYSIHQLDIHNKKAWMPFDFTTEKLGGVNFSEYENVYEGEIDGTDTTSILEELWVIFNINHPADFKGHSLSVSDIVVVDEVKYFCDSIGWKKV